MTADWNFHFRLDVNNLNNLINTLFEKKIIKQIKLNGSKLSKNELISLKDGDYLNLDYLIRISKRNNSDDLSVLLNQYHKAGNKVSEDFKLLLVIVARFCKQKCSIIFEPNGPYPIYEGDWSDEIFETKILPMMENSLEEDD